MYIKTVFTVCIEKLIEDCKFVTLIKSLVIFTDNAIKKYKEPCSNPVLLNSPKKYLI